MHKIKKNYLFFIMYKMSQVKHLLIAVFIQQKQIKQTINQYCG